jgi:hypothetical protein
MAGTLGVTETTGAELSQLIASGVHIQREITLKASAGALKRGTVLEMVSVASGQWQKLNTVANARAILLEDVADSAAVQRAQAYFVGKYREKDMIWPDGITTVDKRTAIVALQDRGIIIDEAILAVLTTTTTTTTSSTTTTTTAT